MVSTSLIFNGLIEASYENETVTIKDLVNKGTVHISKSEFLKASSFILASMEDDPELESFMKILFNSYMKRSL